MTPTQENAEAVKENINITKLLWSSRFRQKHELYSTSVPAYLWRNNTASVDMSYYVILEEFEEIELEG